MSTISSRQRQRDQQTEFRSLACLAARDATMRRFRVYSLQWPRTGYGTSDRSGPPQTHRSDVGFSTLARAPLRGD